MASSVDRKGSQDEKRENEEEVGSVDLPAPKGWKKKFTPKKSGTPRRNVVVFISPTGEEIKNKRDLDQFLRAHPGEPPSSEFDWGTGDTPRRSARISGKTKATESPENEPSKKRERKSSAKKSAKQDKENNAEDEAPKEEENADAAVEEVKTDADVEMKDLGDEEHKKDEHTTEKDIVEESNAETGAAENSTEATNKDPVHLPDEMQIGENQVSETPQPPSESKGQDSTNEVSPDEKQEELPKADLLPPLEKDTDSEALGLPLDKEFTKEGETAATVTSDKEPSPKKVGELSDSAPQSDKQEESRPREANGSNCEETQHQPEAPSVDPRTCSLI